MNCLFICEEVSKKNGWATISYHTIREASKKNSVTVLTSSSAKNLPLDNVIYLKILPDFNNKNTIKNLIINHKIIFFSTRNKYDICHVLVEPYTYILFFIKSDKKILTAVGTYIIKSFKLNSIKNLLNRLALLFCVDKIVAISDYSKNVFNNFFILKKCHYVVTPGVESQAQISYVLKEKIFCIIGEIKKRKGVLLTIQAFSDFLKKNNDSKLIIAGSYNSSYGKKCYDYAHRHNLLGNINFLGHIDNVADVYKKSFCNILASQNTTSGDFEGFGLVHLEANSYGIPTIGTYNNGNESAITDGVNGVLVHQNSYESILDGMNKISKLYELNPIMIYNNSYKYAIEKSWENYYLQLGKLYE